MTMEVDSGTEVPDRYRKRSATKNVSSTTGEKANVWYRGKSIASDGPPPRQYNLLRKRSFFQLLFLIFQWEAD
jgi:hypothetical protein